MGGDLQPFFAQRNIDAGASMKRNTYATPAPETRGDHQLAAAIARLERQEGPIADPTARLAPPPLRVTGSKPAHVSDGYSQPQQPSIRNQMQPPVYPQQKAYNTQHQNGSYPYAAPPPQSGGRHSEPAPVLPPRYGGKPAHTPPEHGRSMHGEAPGSMSAAPPPHVTAAIASLNIAGGGTPVAYQSQQHSELWRQGSGDHYDAQLQRQMSGLKAVPHTPRVNSTEAAPETSEMARKRLEMRLTKYNLCERKIKGDGNCQFRAVADQLYRDAKYHEEVRKIAVHHLRSHPDTYAQFVPTDYWKYCWDMEQLGTWGDHVTLQAIADAFGLSINVLTSYPDAAFIAIKPAFKKSERCLYLSFWAEIHYQSLFPKSEPPRSNKILGSKTLHRLFN